MTNSSDHQANQKLTIKMILFFLSGAVLGAPVVGWWLYEIKELSFLSVSGGKWEAKIPEAKPVHAKDVAFYCVDGVSKKTIGCN